MIALTVDASRNSRKNASYLPKRVSFGSFLGPPPKLSCGLLLMSGASCSHIDCFRFLICYMPDSALVERSNAIENQIKPVVPDGIGRFVRDTFIAQF